jgi:uncharacterized protein (TIGR03067 family)
MRHSTPAVRLTVVAWLTLGAGYLAFAADDPVADELEKLQGSYTMVRGEEGGKPLASDVVRRSKLTLTGNKHAVKLGDETIDGTHSVNPLEKPKSIDATDTTGRFAGKMTKGIYKLAGDEFTVCFSPPDEPRPLDFTTKGHPGRFVHVWKRAR